MKLNSPRLLELKKHRRRTILKKVLISGLGFLIFFIFLAYISGFSRLNINSVEIAGNKIVETEAIKEITKEQIAGKYLWLFPKTNILYYPQNTIKNELRNKFKRLKDITLSITKEQTLEISVSEREAKYTWCGAVPDVEAKCSFLDKDGYIFDEAPYFSGEVYFKFYGKNNWTNFQQLISFKKTLEDMELKPVALYLKDDGDMEIFLSKETSAIKPKIILKANSDFQNVAENLEAALTTEPLQSKFKNKYSSLQYIDLRFGNKVYDKFSK